MDGNITEMLEGVLNDPKAMKNIMGMAEKLMGNADTAENTEDAPAVPQRDEAHTDHHRGKIGNDERIALISSLKPYLSPERRQTADALIKALKMMKLADIKKLLN